MAIHRKLKLNKDGSLEVQHFDSGGLTQGGIGGALSAQTNFSAAAPSITTQNFAPQIATLQGQNQNLYNQQQQLGTALLNQANGQGPNPALTELNTATGNNVANQSALAAGQRGAASNVGLLARQAAQQGAATQQQAVGQAATLDANQRLAAQQQLAGLYNNQASQSLQGQSINQSGQAAQNSALTTGQLGADEVNAQIAGANTAQSNSTTGGLIGGIVSPLASLLNKGGVAGKDGEKAATTGKRVLLPDHLKSMASVYHPQRFDGGGIANYAVPANPGINLNLAGGNPNTGKGLGGAMGQGAKSLIGSSGSAGSLEAGSAPIAGGELGATDLGGAGGAGMIGGDAGAAAAGAGASDAGGLILLASQGWDGKDFRSGGGVPGKASVKGDSPKNDTVPAVLSPKEIVLPRSVTMSADPAEAAKQFVLALQKKQKPEHDDFRSALKKAIGNRKAA